MLLAAIKAVSLSYLLGLVALSIAALFWRATAGIVPPKDRANVAFWLVTSTATMSLVLAAYIYWGVVTFHIQMVTNYFHRLMYGGWGNAILIGGMTVLGISLALALHGWRRSRVPRAGEKLMEAGKLPVRYSEAPVTLSLVGVLRPEIWVNPEYWATLDSTQREHAIAHELVHLRRGDNLRKLILQFIAALYYAVPWVRVWPVRFELYSEFAVDHRCTKQLGEPAYLNLMGTAASFLLQTQTQVVSSHFNEAGISLRLGTLEATQLERRDSTLALICVSGVVLSLVPLLALLMHPVLRCLLACYLGY